MKRKSPVSGNQKESKSFVCLAGFWRDYRDPQHGRFTTGLIKARWHGSKRRKAFAASKRLPDDSRDPEGHQPIPAGTKQFTIITGASDVAMGGMPSKLIDVEKKTKWICFRGISVKREGGTQHTRR